MEQNILSGIIQTHFNKRCTELNDMGASINDVLNLNTALLDNDQKRVKLFKDKLMSEDCNYNLVDVSDLIKNTSRLKIVYLIPSNAISGGIKILIEQSNELSKRGNDVLLFSHCPKPKWISCYSNYFFVNPNSNLSDVIPRADIVIAGYWDLVVDALKIDAPLKYLFVQDDFDIVRSLHQTPYILNAIKTAYKLPLRILTVSDVIKERINKSFGRKSIKIPNALSSELLSTVDVEKKGDKPLNILLARNDNFEFKGHEIILEVLHYLKALGHDFNVNLITHNENNGAYSSFGFEVKEFLISSQNMLKNIYLDSDIFICDSHYESFNLHALEAIASNTAVVISDNGSAKEYAKDGFNCLTFDSGNALMLASKLKTLLNNQSLCSTIKSNGLLTAKKFTWVKSIGKLKKEFNKPVIQAFRY